MCVLERGWWETEEREKCGEEIHQVCKKWKAATRENNLTHRESQNVWKEKWRQSLRANSHHISWPSSASADHTSLSTGAVIKPSLQVCGWVILTRVNRTRLMVRNSTQGPQSWSHNGDCVNEKVVNVWVGADNIYVAASLRVLFYFLLPCVMLWAKYTHVLLQACDSSRSWRNIVNAGKIHCSKTLREHFKYTPDLDEGIIQVEYFYWCTFYNLTCVSFITATRNVTQ